MKKIISLALALTTAAGFLAFALAGCAKKNDGKDLIRLNEVTHSIFYAPLYAAVNKGFFDDENIKIELTNGGGADKSMTAVMSGQADIGLMGPEAAVYVKLGGSNNYPVVFGQLTKKDGSFLVSRKAEPSFKWADLAGKEVIGGRQGGMPAMSLEYALKRNNLIDKQNMSINYDVQFDLIVAAFEGGTGDYCTMFEPAASQYQAEGKGHIVASVGAEAGLLPYTCFMATKSYVTSNNELVTRFMRAVIRGIDFVKTADDADIADALAPSFPATDKGLIVSSVASYKAIDAYMSTPVLTEDTFNTLIDLLISSKAIDKGVAYADIVDNSISKSLL